MFRKYCHFLSDETTYVNGSLKEKINNRNFSYFGKIKQIFSACKKTKKSLNKKHLEDVSVILSKRALVFAHCWQFPLHKA